MKTENHQLREMLEQVNSNYNALQMHLASLMQDQKAEESEEQQVFDGKKRSENGGAVLVPRQFMDLGLATNAETDEPSSSSMVRSQDPSGSPGGNNNNMEVASKELVKNGNVVSDEGLVYDEEKKEFGRGGINNEREDSPSGHALAADKVPRFSPPKNVDQAEATMRKARVSVRARSEAPMVIYSELVYFNFTTDLSYDKLLIVILF